MLNVYIKCNIRCSNLVSRGLYVWLDRFSRNRGCSGWWSRKIFCRLSVCITSKIVECDRPDYFEQFQLAGSLPFLGAIQITSCKSNQFQLSDFVFAIMLFSTSLLLSFLSRLNTVPNMVILSVLIQNKQNNHDFCPSIFTPDLSTINSATHLLISICF